MLMIMKGYKSCKSKPSVFDRISDPKVNSHLRKQLPISASDLRRRWCAELITGKLKFTQALLLGILYYVYLVGEYHLP